MGTNIGVSGRANNLRNAKAAFRVG